MKADHPALLAAQNSWRCVQAGDKEGWLALMDDDICVEDPIGVAVTNPTGDGVRGKAALADFWEKNIAPATITIETHGSRTAGMESAHQLTLRTRFENGVTSAVTGYFIYQINEAGLLTNLRGYWDMDDMAFEQAEH
jgi:steroid delta-isomerase